MQRLLESHVWNLVFPKRTPSRFTTFAHNQITMLQSVSVTFMAFKPHLRKVIEVKCSPPYMDVADVRMIVALVLFLIQHLSQTKVCNCAKFSFWPVWLHHASKTLAALLAIRSSSSRASALSVSSSSVSFPSRFTSCLLSFVWAVAGVVGWPCRSHCRRHRRPRCAGG